VVAGAASRPSGTSVQGDPRSASNLLLVPAAILGSGGLFVARYLQTHRAEEIVAEVERRPDPLLAAAGVLALPVLLFGLLDWAKVRRPDYEPPTIRVQVARSLAYGVALALANVFAFLALHPAVILRLVALRTGASFLAVLPALYALGAWFVCFRRRRFVVEELVSFREAAQALRDTNDFVLGRTGSDWKTGGGIPRWFLVPEKAMFTNLYVLGGIGSGKTSSVAYPMLEQALFKWPRRPEKKIGIFLLDAKGDNAAYVLERARAAGREEDVVVIRPGGDWSYNPIGWGTPTAIANKLVAALQVMTDQESNTYYLKMQREFAENALQILADVLGAGRVSMMDLYEFICDPKVQKRYLDTAAPTNSIAHRWFVNQWLTETPAEQKMLTKGFRADLSSFVRADMAPTFATANANFPGWETLIDEGKIVVFSMSLDEYGPFARAMGIFTLMDFQNVMLARTTTKFREAGHDVERLVLCIIDEVWAYMNEKLGEFTAVSRQAKCCTLALHQSLGQVDDHYRQVLLGNFRTPIVFSVNDLLTLNTFSQLFGTHKVLRTTRSESAGYSGVQKLLLSDSVLARSGGESRNVSISTSEIDEPRFRTDEILHLGQNLAIVQMFDGAVTHSPTVVETLRMFDPENRLG
jgi:hypothetical protein